MNIQAIIPLINQANAEQLDQLQQAINRRRQQLADGPLSTVVERRDYQNGVLQLERRAYRRKKDGGLTTRGPYWYFHYRERGQQKTFYLGKMDAPEGKVDEKHGKGVGMARKKQKGNGMGTVTRAVIRTGRSSATRARM